MEYTVFEELVGKTPVRIYQSSETINTDSWRDIEGDQLHFVMESGEHYVFYHEQDCCENVSIESIVGDLTCLIGNPLLMAEVVTKHEEDVEYFESCTWSFYKFATIKGYVDVRWVGSSNGYYSEEVSLIELKD